MVHGIIDDIKNKLISIKIDCVKRHSRSIMGVNIQYIKDDKLLIFTLAMIELNQQHTALYLKEKVNIYILNNSY